MRPESRSKNCSQIVQNAIIEQSAKLLKRLAPQAGFEPATLRLTEAKIRHYQAPLRAMKIIRLNEIAQWLSHGSITVNSRHNRCFEGVTSQSMSHGFPDLAAAS